MMTDYKDFTNFIKEVKLNNVFKIKSELTNIIFFLKGDVLLVNDAINYAVDNSDFKLEEHIDFLSEIELQTDEDMYIYENGLLLNNFSKERLEKVIKLYHQLPKSQIIEEEIEIENNSKSTINKQKIIIAAVAIVTIAAVAYKCLK